jgi:hypothetical protein
MDARLSCRSEAASEERTTKCDLFQPPGSLRLNLFFARELAGGELAVDQVAVDGDLETASFARHEFQAGNSQLEPLQQSSRQTDGLRLVASGGAITQMQAHDMSPYLAVTSLISWAIFWQSSSSPMPCPRPSFR